jgi:hypothetical protein
MILFFCCAQVKKKFKDDLLIGSVPLEKVKIVLNDPKFGMFSLFKWHFKKD